MPGFVYLYLRSPLFAFDGEKNMTGTAGQKRLPTGYFATRAFPLPPTEEQSRIIAKVDELMALCVHLERQQQDHRRLQNALRQSTLQPVAAAGPRELRTNWTRLTQNFGRLFREPEDLEDLRKSVLDLAVSGYLSEPADSDEPSSVLLNRILNAKERKRTEGSGARKRHVKPETLQETVLPAHWQSVTLDDAISTIDAGWSPACLPVARDDEIEMGSIENYLSPGSSFPAA